MAEKDGVYTVPDRGVALRHRLQVGTIVSQSSMLVKWLSGGTLGQIEESFIARLNKGDCFVFGGRVLELVRMPDPHSLLVEQHHSREGHHLFFYPCAGRLVPLGLASLLGWRLAQARPNTFSISSNDYGFELLAAEPLDLAMLHDGRLFSAGDGSDAGPSLMTELLASLNSTELAQRRFREIARVAGLVFSGYPGAPKSSKQLQATAGLFYQVLRQYDPQNRLLDQAGAEVLAQELDLQRLASSLARMRGLKLMRVDLAAPSPLALALKVERFREQLSTEKLADRLARIVAEANAVIDAAQGPTPVSTPVKRRSGRRSRV